MTRDPAKEPVNEQLEQARSVQRILLSSWWAFLASGLILLSLEFPLVWMRSAAGAGMILRYTLSSLAIMLWVSLLMAGTFSVLQVLGRAAGVGLRRLPPALASVAGGVGWGLAAAGIGLLVLKPWNLYGSKYGVYHVLPAAGALAGLTLRLILPRLNRWAFAGLLFAGLALAFSCDAFLYRHLYRTVHNLACFLALVFGMIGLWRLRRRWFHRRALAALFGVAALAHLALLGGLQGIREIGVYQGVMQSKLLGVLHRFIDLDRDGYSWMFGGGDCDDLDDQIRPGRCEAPGNGVDDNCNGLTDPPAAARSAPTSRRRRSPAPDVYLVLADALRADMGGRGDRAAVVRVLRPFGRRSVRFTAAYTPYPRTFYGINAMTRSRYWRHIGEGHPTMFDVMARAGYDVQLWICDDQLRQDRGGKPLLTLDYKRGNPFLWEAGPRKVRWSRTIIDRAIAEIRADGGGGERPPRFRWLHMMDLHRPFVRGKKSDPLEVRYRAEVDHVMEQFGRLIAALQENERGRRAVIILTADHGEELGEHGGFFHGSKLFDESTRVPMLMRLPGVAARVEEAPASVMDILPTLAHYLGIDARAGWQGRDWLAGDAARWKGPRVLGQVMGLDHWGGLELPSRQMVHDGRFKLIASVDDNIVELYDLKADPHERKNLAAARRDVARGMLEALARWQDLAGCREPN